MTAVLLALLTAVAYGLANYLGPVLTRTRPLAGVLLVAQTIGLAGAVLLVAVVGGAAPHGVALVEGLLAGAFNGLALATLYPAAAAGPMSIVAPIGATGAVVPVVVALAAGERPSALQLVGIPVALVGVVLAAARDSGGGAHAAPRTLALAALSAVAFGAFLTFFGRASHAGAGVGGAHQPGRAPHLHARRGAGPAAAGPGAGRRAPAGRRAGRAAAGGDGVLRRCLHPRPHQRGVGAGDALPGGHRRAGGRAAR